MLISPQIFAYDESSSADSVQFCLRITGGCIGHIPGINLAKVTLGTIKDGKAKGNVKASLDGKGLKFSITAPDMSTFFVEQI